MTLRENSVKTVLIAHTTENGGDAESFLDIMMDKLGIAEEALS